MFEQLENVEEVEGDMSRQYHWVTVRSDLPSARTQATDFMRRQGGPLQTRILSTLKRNPQQKTCCYATTQWCHAWRPFRGNAWTYCLSSSSEGLLQSWSSVPLQLIRRELVRVPEENRPHWMIKELLGMHTSCWCLDGPCKYIIFSTSKCEKSMTKYSPNKT